MLLGGLADAVETVWGLHTMRFATKKAGGSSRNGRDSLPKHLGAKLSDGQFAQVGAMIYKQRGTKILPGFGVKAGKNGSLHALVPGVVRYTRDSTTRRQSASIEVRICRLLTQLAALLSRHAAYTRV